MKWSRDYVLSTEKLFSIFYIFSSESFSFETRGGKFYFKGKISKIFFYNLKKFLIIFYILLNNKISDSSVHSLIFFSYIEELIDVARDIQQCVIFYGDYFLSQENDIFAVTWEATTAARHWHRVKSNSLQTRETFLIFPKKLFQNFIFFLGVRKSHEKSAAQ